MKEETKKQLPSYGAIILAIVGMATTSIQYCNTVEETRQVEMAQKASNEVIIDGLSKEIERVQTDLNALYKKTERLSIQQEFMTCEPRLSVKSTLSDPVILKPLPRPQVRSAEAIKEDIYQSMGAK